MNTVLPPAPEVASWARTPLNLMRWGAVFAGVAVGLAVHLLLTLLGAAAGFSALDAGVNAGTTGLSVAAGTWNTVSMLAAAFSGAYVAARTSGLGRSSDGVLYGVVSWGATTVFFALLATTALSAMAGGLFSRMIPPMTIEQAEQPIEQAAPGMREPAARGSLTPQRHESSTGSNADLRTIQVQSPSPGTPAGERAVELASATTWWLFGALLGSLVLAVIGGAAGARGTSRRLPTRTVH